MKRYILLLVTFYSTLSYAVDIEKSSPILSGDYNGDASRKFYIGIYRNNGFQLVDSVMISEQGTISVSLKDEWRGILIVACGDYERSWSDAFRNANPETSLQFVFDGQDIEYETSWRYQSHPAYLKYGEGCESTLALKELNKRYNVLQERIYYIEKLIEKTPKESIFQTELQREFSFFINVFNTFCDSVSNNFNGQPFMQLHSQLFKQVIPPDTLTFDQRAEWIAEHLFDYCNLQNPATANIPLFSDKIRQYLYLNMPIGIASTDAIERLQKEALERLQSRCSFLLPIFQSEEQQLRQQVLSTRMDELYVSPDYHDKVNSWLSLYNPGSGRFQGMFAEDMLTVINKIQDPEVFTGFANDLLTICTQFGWDSDGVEIAEYLSQNQSRLKDSTGIIRRAIANGRLRSGMPAPTIVGMQDFVHEPSRGILLIFYESGCHNCESQLEELKEHYNDLQKRGIKVISISADEDQNVFEYHSKDFLWPDKLCDLKGYLGDNFKNYGITGTPTIYIINEKGIVTGRYAKLEETKLINNKDYI